MRQDHNHEIGEKKGLKITTKNAMGFIVQERGDLYRQRPASSQARGESQRGKAQVSLFSLTMVKLRTS